MLLQSGQTVRSDRKLSEMLAFCVLAINFDSLLSELIAWSKFQTKIVNIQRLKNYINNLWICLKLVLGCWNFKSANDFYLGFLPN